MVSSPRHFWRGVALAIVLLLGAAAVAARAQAPHTTPVPAAAPGSKAELQELIRTLQNPAARAKLIATLQALVAAAPQKVAQAPAAAAAPATPAAGQASFFDTMSQHIDSITGEILEAARVIVDAPRLLHWIKAQFLDRALRDFWRTIIIRLAIIFGAGFIADRVTRALVAAPTRQIEGTGGTTVMMRLVLLALGIVIEMLPALAFAVIASFTVPLTHAHFGTREVARVLIAAILWTRIVLAVARVALLSESALRLYPLGGETRQYLYIWTRRFTGWAVYGYSLAAGTWWLGVPGAIYALLLRTTTLVLAILAIVFVLQNRKTVADWLRGGHGPRNGRWRIIRQRFADTWHVLAVIYVIGTFGVYVLDVHGGFLFLLRATVITIVVLLAATLIVRGIEGATRRGFAISPDLKRRYPTLEARANRYLPALYVITATIIYAFAALSILQAWGINAFAWLGTSTGRRVTGTSITIAIVIVTALVLWEFFSSAIERYLNTTGHDGNRVARSARARTLLPLVRTAMLIIVVVMVALIVLSEIGVDIAPLLAGAGVVGLAIGFGSQTLVKDFITGLFILIEDTLAVGDVVDVGNNHSGVVEAISIRAMRLRDMAGTVHTVPFSAVTTVKNLTKDYSYYVANIGVAYSEDTDRVIEVLRSVADELRQDPAIGPLILEPMEVVGVDHFDNSAVVIVVRFKTPPIQQWTVGREFNRRMKKAFDANDIEMPYPYRTIVFGDERIARAVAAASSPTPSEKPVEPPVAPPE